MFKKLLLFLFFSSFIMIHSGCGEDKTTSKESHLSLEKVFALTKKQPLPQARKTWSNWWKAQDNQFQGLKGSIVGLDWCRTNATPCVALTIAVQKGKNRLLLTQNHVSNTTLKPESKIWAQLLAASQYKLKAGQCVNVTGKVSPNLLGKKDIKFAADFSAIKPCPKGVTTTASKATINPNTMRQIGFVQLLRSQLKNGKKNISPKDLQKPMAAFMSDWDGSFQDWRGSFAFFNKSGGWFSEDVVEVVLTLAELKTEHEIRLYHPNLKKQKLVDPKGAAASTEGGAFEWYRPLKVNDPALTGLVRSGSGARDCMQLSGRLYPALQTVKNQWGPTFFTTLDTLSSCNRAIKIGKTQSSVLQALQHLTEGKAIGGEDDAERNIITAAIPEFWQQYGQEHGGTINQWQGIVRAVEGDKHNAQLDVEVGCKGCKKYSIMLRLKWYIHGDDRSELFLKTEVGDCLRVNGIIKPKGWNGKMKDQVYTIDPTKLEHCGKNLSLAQAAANHHKLMKKVDDIAAPIVGGVVASGAAAAMASAAVTTTTILQPVGVLTTTAGESILILGETEVVASSLGSVLGAGVAITLAAAYGYYMVYGKHIQEMQEADYRALNQEAAHEYLAYAKHICGKQGLNSKCVREAFHQSATLVSSSQQRIDTLLGKVAAKTSVQKKWLAQWKKARSKESGDRYFDMANVLQRVGKMSTKTKAACRPKVDLVHEMLSERRIMHVSTTEIGNIKETSEALYLNLSCLDLFFVEQDYLDQEGLHFVWKEAFIKAYGNTPQSEGAAKGWSDGRHAEACSKQQKRLRKERSEWSGGLFATDCKLRVFGGKIKCACDQTPLAKAVKKQDEKAFKKFISGSVFPDIKRWRKDRKKAKAKAEAAAEKAKKDQARQKKQDEQREIQRLLKEEQEASK